MKVRRRSGSGEPPHTLTTPISDFFSMFRQEDRQQPDRRQNEQTCRRTRCSSIGEHAEGAAPTPPMPNAKPKNRPEIMPSGAASCSCAYDDLDYARMRSEHGAAPDRMISACLRLRVRHRRRSVRQPSACSRLDDIEFVYKSARSCRRSGC